MLTLWKDWENSNLETQKESFLTHTNNLIELSPFSFFYIEMCQELPRSLNVRDREDLRTRAGTRQILTVPTPARIFSPVPEVWSAAVCMIITIKMAAEGSSPAKQHKNILIGVTGSVASIKLSKLVDGLLLLQPKVSHNAIHIFLSERNGDFFVTATVCLSISLSNFMIKFYLVGVLAYFKGFIINVVYNSSLNIICF